MSKPAFYFGAVFLGVILNIVSRGLGLGGLDHWGLIVFGALFYYATCWPSDKEGGS